MPDLNFSKLSGAGGGGGPSCPQPGQTPTPGYESCGERPNNSQKPPRPPRVQRNGGDFPGDDDDDDDDDEEDDEGYGVNPRRRHRAIGWCNICQKDVWSNQESRWCVICSNNLIHVKCLRHLGRAKPECLRCEDFKIKKQ
eukprot:5254382-Amphidinium_carterae.1